MCHAPDPAEQALDARNARRRGLRASARIGVGDAPSQASPRGVDREWHGRDVSTERAHRTADASPVSLSRARPDITTTLRSGSLQSCRGRNQKGPDRPGPGTLGTSVGSRTPSGREPTIEFAPRPVSPMHPAEPVELQRRAAGGAHGVGSAHSLAAQDLEHRGREVAGVGVAPRRGSRRWCWPRPDEQRLERRTAVGAEFRVGGQQP